MSKKDKGKKRERAGTEIFNPYKVYRYAADWNHTTKNYNQAIKLYALAEENAKNVAQRLPIYSKRSDAYWHRGDMAEAEQDLLKGFEIGPDDIALRKTKGDLMFQRNRFEEALGIYKVGHKEKPTPPRFQDGLQTATGTIKTTVGSWAGEIMSDLLLGPHVVEMKIRSLGLYPKPLKRSDLIRRRKMRKIKGYETAYSKIYLGKLADDKACLTDWLNDKTIFLENKKHNNWLEDILTGTIRKLNEKQDALWKRKPIYTTENSGIVPPKVQAIMKQKPIVRANFIERRIQQLLKIAANKLNEKDYAYCLKTAETVREIVNDEPEYLIPQKYVYLEKCINLVGQMYLSTKCLLKNYNQKINDERIMCILGATSHLTQTNAHALYNIAFHPPIAKIKKYIDDQLENFNLSENPLEKAYLSHEIGAAYSLSKQSDLMRTMANLSILYSKRVFSKVWYMNALFLLVRTELEECNLNEAKEALYAVKKAAIKFGFIEAQKFAERGLILLEKEEERTKGEEDIMEKREREIVELMYNEDYKVYAMKVINRLNQLPREKRMHLVPGLEAKVEEKIIQQEVILSCFAAPDDDEEQKMIDKKIKENAKDLMEKVERRPTFDFENTSNPKLTYLNFK